MFFTILFYISIFFIGFITSIGFKHKTTLYNLHRLGVTKQICRLETWKKLLYLFIMMCKTTLYYLIQTYMFQHVTQISPDVYEVKCVLNNKLHVLRYKIKHKYNRVLQITDINMNDLTTIIEPYVNGYDLELLYLTPNDFHKDKIFLERFDGECDTFQQSDKIIIKNKLK